MNQFAEGDAAEKLDDVADGKGKEAEKIVDLQAAKTPGEAAKVKERLEGANEEQGLNARLRFLYTFLAKHREKYAMSTEQTMGQFLKRMLEHNPEKISTQYIKIFLGFGESTSKPDLMAFGAEIKYFLSNVGRVKQALIAGRVGGQTVRPLRTFEKVMELLRETVEDLIELDDDERRALFRVEKEVVEGGKEPSKEEKKGLNGKQKSILKRTVVLVERFKRYGRRARKKEEVLKRHDRAMAEAFMGGGNDE